MIQHHSTIGRAAAGLRHSRCPPLDRDCAESQSQQLRLHEPLMKFANVSSFGRAAAGLRDTAAVRGLNPLGLGIVLGG